ncbi:hypothetical protein FBU30_009628 [Linnemannia zychae]|nr:hypothetical protein FBU30_009628 [Linnemannia zychae]
MSPRNSKGPSIIDLSSGEELMPILHFNDKEQHKRRRNSLCDSPTSESTESLHQRFELQDDGTLLPILDPSPTDPSPPKKMRISKANRHQYLHFLSDDESEIERLSSKMKAGLRRKKAHHSFIGSNRTYRSVNTGRIACNGGTTVFSTTEAIGSSHVHQGSYTGTKIFWSDQRTDLTAGDTSHAEDALFDQMGSFHKEEPSKEDEQLCLSSCNSDPQALILYKGPRNVSLTPYYQAYDQDQWLDDRNNGLIELEWPQGHEMVYYQNEPTSCDSSTRFGQRRSILWGDYDALNEGSTTSVLIEELNDDIDDDEDDGNLADDEENDLSDDAPLRDLEEHVADMDLD